MDVNGRPGQGVNVSMMGVLEVCSYPKQEQSHEVTQCMNGQMREASYVLRVRVVYMRPKNLHC